MAALRERSAGKNRKRSGGEGREAPADLEEVLDAIEHATNGAARVSFGDVVRAVGRRSFGPLLLLPGLIIFAPIVGDIPGVPTAMAFVVAVIAGQMLLQREHFWLPRWVLDRSLAADKVAKAAGWLREPARFVDRFLRPRLEVFVTGPGEYTIAAVALAIALFTPAMEVVPFSANGAGAVLTAFGLALIARDGAVAAAAIALAGLTAAAVVFAFVSV
jgi:hypothetical protein